ncbi:MAG: type IV pili methyl-accepting chemotaxis transducer N-terminal domain-containing protein [Magnetococcales bacterium]|nr:type IV pili methyl-accepting chemotaxis transducer N-terminal domain-containing protein [Magnetococcales bacterium]
MVAKPFPTSRIVTLVALFLTTLLLLPAVSQAGGPTAAQYGTVLNLSGKQRMLTQKMSKEVMLVALGVDTDANLKNLKGTADLFDKTLKGLRDGSAELKLPPTESKRILKQLGKVEKLWKEFNKPVQEIISSGTVSKDQVAAIAAQNLPLLKNMNKCVKLYEKDAAKAGLKADPSLAVTINLAGKQRMLTQKMSKEYLMVAYGHETENNKLNLLETYSLFERTLKGLQDGDSTLDLPGTKNQEIRGQLGVVQGLWDDFKPVVAEGADPKTTSFSADKLKKLANTNLPLLKNMNKAVGMFAKEAAGK